MKDSIFETTVAPAWVDYNQHMNDAEYARVFSYAVDAFWEAIGLDEAARKATGVTTFTLESHICYLAECNEAESLRVALTVLDRDSKRFHLFFELFRADDTLAATCEQMLMAIDHASHTATAFPKAVARAADAYELCNKAWPTQAGRRIGIRRG